MYHVWRRSDGYVSVSNSGPRVPNYLHPKEFEILGSFEEWEDALDCIQTNRDDRHRAIVKSWKFN